MKLRSSLFLALIGCSLGLGVVIRDRLQDKIRAQVVMTGDALELPFEDYGGHLYLQGQINRTQTKDLVVDTGAADLFVSEARAKTLGLKPQGQVNIPGPSKTIATAYVPNVSIQLGGPLGTLMLHDSTTVMIPQGEVGGLERYFGRPVSGILGYELFEQLVVEIDYSRQVMRFFRPQAYHYGGKGQRLPLRIEGDRPFIDATVTPYGSATLPSKLMVDLGSNAALSLEMGCGLEQQLIAAAPRTLRRNLVTIQGAKEIVLGRVQRIQLGTLTLPQPLTIFGKGKGEDCDRATGKIGYQILRQFKIILDYPHRQLILDPLASPRPSYDYDLSGLWLEAKGTQLKTYRVGAVSPQTPAAVAGVQVGDSILAVNNAPVSSLTLVEVRRRLSQPGRTVDLRLQRNTAQISVRLKLQPLL